MFGIGEIKLDEIFEELIIGNIVSLSLEDEIMVFASEFEYVSDEEIIKQFENRCSKEDLILLIASLRKENLI